MSNSRPSTRSWMETAGPVACWWLDFFLAGVADTVNQAFEAATRIVDLFKEDRERIRTESDRAGSALRIRDPFQQNPFLTADQLVQQTGARVQLPALSCHLERGNRPAPHHGLE